MTAPFQCPNGHPLEAADAVCLLCATAAGPRPAVLSVPLPEVAGYQILSELGRGGMGVVYLARDVQLGRLVAVKMIRDPDVGERDLAQFRREAEAIARLQHPNVVQIHAVGESSGRPFLALEYVEDGSLEELLGGAPQAAAAAARAAEVLARAVQEAHARGIVHRDLKPLNVLVRRGADGGPGLSLENCTFKISDFGLAKNLAAAETTRSGALGTPSYMAPEQAWGGSRVRPVGPSADVHALGAILYKMLTGRPPFLGESVGDTLQQVMTQDPVPPSRLRPGLPRDLETICLKCLEKDPARRYASAGALADDLRRYLAGLPIVARPVGPLARAWKWARRNPGRAAVAGSVVLILAVVALAAWGVQAREARRVEQAREEDAADFAMARSQLAADNFAGAEQTLGEATRRLDRERRLADRRPDWDRLGRVLRFYRRRDQTWYLAGEENYELGQLRADEAFAALGVFDHPDWWAHLPDEDLPPGERARLAREAYRLLLFAGAFRMRPGLLKMYAQRRPDLAAADFRAALKVLDTARAWEQAASADPSRTAAILVRMNRRQLGEDDPPGPAPPGPAALTDADYFFLGLMNFYLARAKPRSPLSLNPLYLALAYQVRDFPELDTVRPLETAERLLRTATAREPRNYWAHWVLGRTLLLRGDLLREARRGEPSLAAYQGAELAFTTCIALRPDYARGYEQRALAVGYQAADTSDRGVGAELRGRALADSQRALDLARADRDAATYWPRGQLLALLDLPREALGAYAEALLLEDDILEKVSRSNSMKQVEEYARQVVQQHKEDADRADLVAGAYALAALVDLRQGEPRPAGDAAAAALALCDGQPTALAVRGSLKLAGGEPAEALKDFEKSLRSAPRNYLAAANRAVACEQLGDYEGALKAFDYLLAEKVAVTDRHRALALLGRARALDHLGRSAEARRAEEEAKSIDAVTAGKAGGG